jgi:hypothetical protein
MSAKPHISTPIDCTEALSALVRRAGVSRLMALGNLDLLRQAKLALFCSKRCPASLILKLYDALRFRRIP